MALHTHLPSKADVHITSCHHRDVTPPFSAKVNDAWRRLLIAFLMAAAWIWPASNVAAQTKISTATELNTALRTARGGERFELAPGDYGLLQLRGRPGELWGFDQPIIIRSADPARPAVFSGASLIFTRNLTLTKVKFQYRFQAEDKVNIRPVVVRDSAKVSITDSHFIGDVVSGSNTPADGFGTGIALDVTGSEEVNIERNRFETWHRGIVFNRSSNLIVRGNSVRDLRSDGFNFAQVNNVLIEGNNFSNFRTSLKTGDHPDMIQFWTAKTTAPSTDITIKDNVLDIGKGDWTQSIFMRNEEVDRGRAGPEMFYRNIKITGNFIRNSHLHGITVGETSGLVISNNTLIQAAESPRPRHVTVPAINVSKTTENVRIENNVAPAFPEASAGWVIANNIKVQRNFPRAPDFYGNVFTDALIAGEAPLEAFSFFPNSLLPSMFEGKTTLGAPMNQFNERPTEPRLLITSAALYPGRGSAHRLEVAAAYDHSGRLDLTDAKAEWKLGPAIALPGLRVVHTFEKPGSYRPEVILTLRNGKKLSGARTIVIE